ncbi:MerR family transcriptional regulator [Acinetobacter zhairhuonensis]|uniref:MerR family transcriptional regulator n=1 Tax=Acinetobacter sp. A7.4 TaxID=2919921 RepID=UPI001F4EEA91|nr:MerR family transcriptional regulator [Acinetobacter sp. A7.4]MCJ8160823.1 MerR family transcriptional regulator [Acinetobacter sp. A7.4]
MYIGELAALTGASPKAIRHYEKLGLLPIAKRKGNYRIYEAIDVQSVKMIRLAQAVGFSLSELLELSVLKYQQNQFPVEVAKVLIANKHQQILKHQQALNRLQENLKQLEDEITQTYMTSNSAV